MQNSLEQLNLRRAKLNYQPPAENTILTIQEQSIGNTQSFVCFQGLPKAGKSLFVTTTIASAFHTNGLFGIKLQPIPDRPKIAFFDTESSESDFYKIISRINYQVGSKQLPYNIDMYLCREDPHYEIINMINAYLDNNKDCSVLIIDGIADLLSNFNDVVESNVIIQWLKKISKIHNLLVICVLHLTKKDKMSLGHLGSFMDRKAQSVLICEKKDDMLVLNAGYLRSSTGIKAIELKNTDGVWYQNNANVVTNNADVYGIDKIRLLNNVFRISRTYNDMINDISEQIGKSTTTVKKLVKDWITSGDIIKIDGLYNLKNKNNETNQYF
jgi:hypothetical protein